MQTPAWILKSCFAYSGGFALPSIRKICTLHRYESENLALLKLFFHLLSTLAKMLNSRLTYSECLSFFFGWLMIYHLFRSEAWQRSQFYNTWWSGSGIQNVSQQYFPLYTVYLKNKIPLCMHGDLFHTHAHIMHLASPEVSHDDILLLFLLCANRAALEM